VKGPSIRELLQASAVTSLLLAAPPGSAQGSHSEGEKVELSPYGAVEIPGTNVDERLEPTGERSPARDGQQPSSDPSRSGQQPAPTPPQAAPPPAAPTEPTPSTPPATPVKESTQPTAAETETDLSPGAGSGLSGMWAGGGLGIRRLSPDEPANLEVLAAFYKTFGRIVGVGLITEVSYSGSAYVLPTLHLGRKTFGDVGLGLIDVNGDTSVYDTNEKVTALLGAGCGHHFFVANPGLGHLTVTPRLLLGIAGDDGALLSLSVAFGYWFRD